MFFNGQYFAKSPVRRELVAKFYAVKLFFVAESAYFLQDLVSFSSGHEFN